MASLSMGKHRMKLNKLRKFGENFRDIALSETKKVKKHIENLQFSSKISIDGDTGKRIRQNRVALK